MIYDDVDEACGQGFVGEWDLPLENIRKAFIFTAGQILRRFR